MESDLLKGGVLGAIIAALFAAIGYMGRRIYSTRDDEVAWYRLALREQRQEFLAALALGVHANEAALERMGRDWQEGVQALCERLENMEERMRQK